MPTPLRLSATLDDGSLFLLNQVRDYRLERRLRVAERYPTSCPSIFLSSRYGGGFRLNCCRVQQAEFRVERKRSRMSSVLVVKLGAILLFFFFFIGGTREILMNGSRIEFIIVSNMRGL